jgi:hypothetical protein
MAGFDAGSIVEPMNWDFSKFGGGSGTVPEPSDAEVERFLKKYQVLVTQTLRTAELNAAQQLDDAISKAAGTDESRLLTLQESISVMSQIDSGELASSSDAVDALVDLFASICKGSPSKEQLMSLPHRIRAAFYGWLMGQLTNPDFSAAADTKSSPVHANGG